uniref:Uncharacterized protein n=1 Tax=Leersia perrieri TaxID=77586 RepID=A0A0D9XCP6_9ORYZ
MKEGCFRSSAMKVVTASVGSVVLTPMEETTWMFLFSVNLETMKEGDDLRVFTTWQHGYGEWVLEKSFQLAAATTVLEAFTEVVMARVGLIILAPWTKWMLSVNLETLEVASHGCCKLVFCRFSFN